MSPRKSSFLPAAALALAFALPRAAWASCGAATCEMESAGPAPRPERSVRLGYEFEFVPQSKRWTGRHKAGEAAAGEEHEEKYSVTRLHRLTAAVGLSERWSASLQLPLMARDHGHVHHDGAEMEDEAWSVKGLGDLLVEARYAFWKDDQGSTVSLGAGVELPTGLRSARNESGQSAELGILPGSGSYDALATLLWQRPIGSGGLFASVSRRFNGSGERGYRLGDVTMAHAGGSAPVWRGLGATLQLNAIVRERDHQGDTDEETGHTGGEFLYVSPGLEYSAGGGLSFMAAVQLPLYQRVNGYQLVADYGVRTGVGYRFSF